MFEFLYLAGVVYLKMLLLACVFCVRILRDSWVYFGFVISSLMVFFVNIGCSVALFWLVYCSASCSLCHFELLIVY